VTDCLSIPRIPFEKLSGKNQLTPDQEQSLYTFEGQFTKSVESKVSDLHSLERQQQDLMTAAQIDTGKVRDMQKQINDTKDTITNMCLDQQLKALDILTPEQRHEIQILMIKEHNRHHWI
jgi:Spy/CpxP family protein refolding chaperone